MAVAPRPVRRSLSASNRSVRRSRWRRFLTVLGSGTLWKESRGPLAGSVASIAACSAPAPGLTGRPSASDQNAAKAAASAQSMLRPTTEMVMSASFLLHANEHQQGEAGQHHQLGAAVLSGADQAVAAHREDDGGHSG